MVDLPAPFWPTSAWTSPRAIARLAPTSAGTPEKLLSIPSMRRSGDGSLIGCPEDAEPAATGVSAGRGQAGQQYQNALSTLSLALVASKKRSSFLMKVGSVSPLA